MIDDYNDPPPVIIHLWDDDTITKDFMGSCLINIKGLKMNEYEYSDP